MVMIPYSKVLTIKKAIAADLEAPEAMAFGTQKTEKRLLLGVSRGNVYIYTQAKSSSFLLFF